MSVYDMCNPNLGPALHRDPKELERERLEALREKRALDAAREKLTHWPKEYYYVKEEKSGERYIRVKVGRNGSSYVEWKKKTPANMPKTETWSCVGILSRNLLNMNATEGGKYTYYVYVHPTGDGVSYDGDKLIAVLKKNSNGKYIVEEF